MILVRQYNYFSGDSAVVAIYVHSIYNILL